MVIPAGRKANLNRILVDAREPLGNVLQEELDAATAGGGGGGAPVLTADPGVPALNEQWILRIPEAAPTSITGTIGRVAFPSVIELDVLPTPTLSDLEALSGNSTETLNIVDWNDGAGAGAEAFFGVTPAVPGQLLVRFDGMMGSTVQEVVDAINSASQSLISKDVASVGSNVVGGDDFDTKAGTTGTAPITTDGAVGAYTLKIQGDTKIFTQQYTPS